ncbi:DM13 domain-containing protein [Halomicroarcula sp. GCM10025817]|uniref:DM13 domain-containing protein n=1 Tax=Haloarcula TaxID=2237 RepID=UPI0023E7AC15|nr:DM13 domain-containing protein [Halomicroarcula sp. SYNS111]
MVTIRTFATGGAILAVVVVVASLAVIGPSDFFLPEQSTQVDEELADGDAEVLASGSFVGTSGYDVTGTVLLLRDDEGLFLRFENYSQTQGPDVFVYVTPSPTPDSRAEITAGTKVPIDGGADDGESTKEGTFTQRLPEGVTAADINGVGIWCERFSAPFGYAELNPVSGETT